MTDVMEYVPHPGGRIDKAQRAAEHAAPSETDIALIHASKPPEPPEPVPVAMGTTRVANGDTAVYRTLVLGFTQPASYHQILPQDPQRYRAVILAIDNDVILCDTKDLAQSPNNFTATPIPNPDGFYLSKGIPVEIRNQGLCYAVNTSSSANTRVSVVIERYEAA